jgi:tRNA-dihydrouridine synthase A
VKKATPIPDANRRFAVAPMMELSDRHFRYLARLLTRHSLLYTEMLTSKAVIKGDREYLLGTDDADYPVVLQLGGSDPVEMAEAASIGEAWGYDEINMNVGCPSDRVQSGRFGACLMAEPHTVAACVSAMQDKVQVPVTVKCRLGIDRDDSYSALENFVQVVRDAGCQHFIVHARKAWLDGLSPKENRTIPPLRYPFVYKLKETLPDLHITINGGVETWSEVHTHLKHVDGVMSGRKAYYQPAFLGDADASVFTDLPNAKPSTSDVESLAKVARAYAQYVQRWIERDVRASALTRHIVSLYHEVPGARLWRRHMSENASQCTDAVQLVEDALVHVLEPNKVKRA